MYVWFNPLSQSKRNSGFRASDELSSEEEERVQPVEVILPTPHHQGQPTPARPTFPTVSSVRKRNLKSNLKPPLRPQVNLTASLCVLKTGV